MTEVTHGACGKTWSGPSAAHCSGCHETFVAVRLFDLHRTQLGNRGTCKPAKTMRVDHRPLQLVSGVWHEQAPAKPVARVNSRRRNTN